MSLFKGFVASNKKSLQSSRYVLPVVFMLATLSACGGGGGNTGSSAPPSSPPPAAPPPAPGPSLSAANADYAALLVTGPVEYALLESVTIFNTAFILDISDSTTNTFECEGNPASVIELSYTDTDADSSVSPGDTVKFLSDTCDGIASDISLEITRFDTSVPWFEGSLEFEEVYDSGYVIRGNADVSVMGVNRETIWSIENATVYRVENGVTDTVSIDELTLTVESSDFYSLSFSGSVTSETIDADFSFLSTTALSGYFGAAPTAGLILITAGDSGIQMIASSATPGTFELQLDSTGGGQYGSGSPRSWVDFFEGNFYGVVESSSPAIQETRIEPIQPDGDDDLRVVVSATDSDSDSLQYIYQWRRNGILIDSQTADILPESEHRRGDVIEAKVRVSDGYNSVESSVSVTVSNAPPAISETFITPAEPYTFDDLYFASSITDGDGDPLNITRIWRRNGEVVDGISTAIFPSSEHNRGDVITAEVTVDDGIESVTATDVITILDQPAIITLNQPVDQVIYGMPVTFNLSVSDPDPLENQTYEFEILSGPEGMYVNPVTGEVEWTPVLPMFGKSMEVNWQITLKGQQALILQGSSTVVDESREYPMMRTGIQIPVWPSGIEVGDFDSDGDQEALILGLSLYEFEYSGTGYHQSWVYPFYSKNGGHSGGLAVSDIDDDGYHEIFVADNDGIFVLDGQDRSVIASTSINTPNSRIDLDVADLDGDGLQEVVFLSRNIFGDGMLQILSAHDLSPIWEFPIANYGSSVVIGNVDVDSAMEIVTSSGYVFDGATFANQWLYSAQFGINIAVGDIDDNGVDEIVGLDSGTAVRAYSAVSKGFLWEVPTSGLISVTIEDIDGDEVAEIIVGDGQWGNVTAYKYDTGDGSVDVVFQIDSQNHGVSDISSGDLDGDGQIEIIWGSGASSGGADSLVVAGRNPDPEVEWINDNPQQLDGPFYGGQLMGDTLNTAEPLFSTAKTDADYSGTRLIRMDSLTGELEVSEEIGTNYNRRVALTVSDYDKDLTDEVFLATSQSYNGVYKAYDFFNESEEWTSPADSYDELIGVKVIAAVLTGDNREDFVVLSTKGTIYIYNVFQQMLVWQSGTAPGPGVDLAVIDLDGDDVQEIIALTLNQISIYKKSAGLQAYTLHDSRQFSGTGKALEVGDLNGDGNPEIFLLTSNTSILDPQFELIRYDSDLSLQGSVKLAGDATDITIGPESLGHTNLLISISPDRSTRSGFIVSINPYTWLEVWRSPELNGTISKDSIHVVDTDSDGRSEFSIGTSEGMILTR